jgi:filamentous hemagglutinin family protein
MKITIKNLKGIILSLSEVLTIRFLLRAIFIGTVAFAIPEGAKIINGNATVTSPNTQTVQINQTSNKVIIDWNSFNIGANEKAQFIQPSSSAIALNRINPAQGASQIYGQLIANGQVILINGAGIFFGPGSRVDVGNLIASTSNISNANFLAGKYIFNEPSPFGGSVINAGTLIARNNGLVALLGTGVANNGMIEARLGNIVLASGNKFTLDFYGDGLINFTVDAQAARAGVDQNGKLLTNGVSNTGKLIADGGFILVTARAAQGVLNNVIDMEGIAQAKSVSQKNGVIILSGGSQGTINVAGSLNVSSKNNQGGTIKILGSNIQVETPSVLNASGKTGGGEILIGGNAEGAGPELNSNYTFVASNVIINANALLKGNGGRVVVWSNSGTEFYGNITARGGVLGGNGGMVETSGEYLDVAGSNINLSAAHGTTGTWLLYP